MESFEALFYGKAFYSPLTEKISDGKNFKGGVSYGIL